MKTLLTIFLFCFVLQASATNYYFSATGSDGNNGLSQGAPKQTPSAFATILGTASTADSILFKRGDVFTGFQVSSCNSGIRIGAYGTGARPVISGFTSLTSWTETSPGSNLWEASCNSGSNLDEVTVGGLPVPAGRTPNYGSYYNVDSWTNGNPATVTSSSTNAGSINWVGAQIVVRHNEYNLPREWISSHSSTTITYPTTDNPNPIDGAGHKFFIQKHPTTLDAQNEWYYNPVTHVLRMYSITNPSSLNVKAATQDYFFNVDFRNNISISDLKFSGIDSNVIMARYPARFRITGNEFEDIGTDAITFDTDSAAYIYNNIFNRIGNTAVVARYASYTTVNSNVIDSCGVIYGMSIGNNQQRDGIMIEVYNFSGRLGDSITVQDNYVTNTGYCGIRWTGTNALIQRNYVSEFGLIDADGGGIYTNADHNLTNQRIVSDNTIINGHGNHDMYSSTGDRGMPGIYLDDDTGNVDIYNNTIVHTTRGSIYLHNTDKINVKNNILIATNGEANVTTGDDAIGMALRNTVVFNNYMYAQAGAFHIDLSSVNNDYASEGTFSSNRYARSSATTPFTTFGPGGGTYSFASWQSTFGWEMGSTFSVVNDDSLRYEYNETGIDKYVQLTSTYADLSGNGYYNYVKIPAHSGLLLFRKTFGTVKTGRPVKIQP